MMPEAKRHGGVAGTAIGCLANVAIIVVFGFAMKDVGIKLKDENASMED